MKKNCLLILVLFLVNTGFSQKTLSLEECRQMALENNKTLLIAKENVEIASQFKKAAFTQFLPNFSASGAYKWNQKSISLLSEDKHLPIGKLLADGTFVPIDVDGNPFNPSANPEKLQYALLPKSELESNVHHIFIGSISFSQPIYMGGKIRELNKLAKYGQTIAEIQSESATTDLLLEVDEAYWRVVSLEAKVELATQYNQLIVKVDTEMTALIEQGMATKADQLKVKVKQNEAELSLTRAQDGLNLSRMALNQLCGLTLNQQYKLADIDLLGKTPTRTEIPLEQALENRPELRILEQLKQVAESNTKMEQSRFMPSIGLTGGYMISNPNLHNGISKTFSGMFNAGVMANIPLFHFGERAHVLKSSKAKSHIAELRIQDARSKMELQITQSTYRVTESLKKQETTLKNIDNATENLRMANEGFNEGVISSTDLLAAQSAWLAAKSDNIDANIDVRLCMLYLEKAQGEISTKAE